MAATFRVALREIAERTGISRMAVSLALRGKFGVSDATRKKVLKVAKELGYEPDPEVAKLLSHIRANKSVDTKACLALLTSGASPEDWKRYLTERKYVEGAQARAKEYGYHIEEFWMNEPGMTLSRLGNIIWSRGIEGVIIAPLQSKLSGKVMRSVRLDFNLFSAVEISETVEWPDLDRAVHDQYTSMLRALNELSSLNYKTIGLVLEEALDLRVNGKWTAAYLRYRNQWGAKRLPPPLILDFPRQPAFNRWFERYRPSAIISVDRFGLRLLVGRGLDVPGEVGYASLDVDGDANDYPDVSGIDQNSEIVGAAAVDMLVAAIHRGHRGIPSHPLRIEVEGSWKPGKSTAKRTNAAS
ncbi:MAG TPA: LacI family DNA-binding transcriptional regulator [Verrucomicrobiae bacterium]|nr:LacI family DNA-binding transcriptional regulator [Verrucomicrobiae bacterium]